VLVRGQAGLDLKSCHGLSQIQMAACPSALRSDVPVGEASSKAVTYLED